MPVSQIPRCRGLVLHDCHAEILAIRGFNYWLINECRSVLMCDGLSPFIRRRRSSSSQPPCPPLELQADIKIYMYCSCAPCGDASMELCMASQEDPTPWEMGEPSLSRPLLLDGRANFSQLGVVRRKPARADAEPTRSKSCSDKLALRQVVGLLSCETSLLVAPVYLEGLILPDEEFNRQACKRSFAGRMKIFYGRLWGIPADDDISELIEEQEGQGTERMACYYGFRPFKVFPIPTSQVNTVWPYGKPSFKLSKPGGNTKVGNLSVVWAAAPTSLIGYSCRSLPILAKTKTGLYENIINGVKQGNRASMPTAKGASGLSRAKMWGLVRALIRDVPSAYPLHQSLVERPTYKDFKKPSLSASVLGARTRAIIGAKDALKGWVPNEGDESWGLDILVDEGKKKNALNHSSMK